MFVAIVAFRGRCRIPAISKSKLHVTIVNDFNLLAIATVARVIVVSDIVVSDTLAGFLLDVLYLLFAAILSGLHGKPRKKD